MPNSCAKTGFLVSSPLLQLSFPVHDVLPPSNAAAQAKAGVHPLGHRAGGHGRAGQGVYGSAVLGDRQLSGCSQELVPEALPGGAVRCGVCTQTGRLGMADDLNAGYLSGPIHAHSHMNLPAVAGRDGFYHISRGGPVYRLHQAGFIREIFQLFFQDDTFRQNAGKRFFRLFPQSVCNGSGVTALTSPTVRP